MVEIVSEQENILYTDKNIIDINYFNKDHIALLLVGAIQFFNTKELGVTTRIETLIVNLIPTSEGSFEDLIRMIGVTSEGECLKYTVKHTQGHMNIQKIEPLTDDQTVVTTITSSVVNKNRYLLFLGTSFGPSTLNIFSDAAIHDWEKSEQIKNLKKSIVFSNGKSKARPNLNESSSNKLATKCDLNTVLDEIKDPDAKFRNLGIFKPNEGFKTALAPFGINVWLENDNILFLSTCDQTYVLKLDIIDYHMEVLQVYDFEFNQVFMTESHFILIRDSEALNIAFEELAQEPVSSMHKEHDVKIISAAISRDNLVIYTSDKGLRFYKISQNWERGVDLSSPDFTENLPESEDISKIAMDQNILITAVRKIDSNFLWRYEFKVYAYENNQLKFLYSIPIWSEDVNDKSETSLFVTDLQFVNDTIQYTYNHTITIQRKAQIKTIQGFSNYSGAVSWIYPKVVLNWDFRWVWQKTISSKSTA